MLHSKRLTDFGKWRRVLLAAVACVSQVQAADSGEALPARLPGGVSPVHYDVLIEPDARELRYRGRETIDIVVRDEARSITLNALDLELSDVRLDGLPAADIALDAAAQTATFTFPGVVKPGPHQLALSFTGKIGTSAAGMFAVDYSTKQGPQRMLTTQLEAVDGRRFIPMWDEPAAKATFTLEVVIPAEQDAFSNMPETSRRIVGAKKHVRFQATPKMSSYLLHVTIGDLERTARTISGVDVGVVTRKGARVQTKFALDAVSEILPWYNEYFGTPYPLPKLDMIAAPGTSQFFAAMENWGAILYFESALLVDPARAGQSQRQWVFDTVAHEVAHQWFGNLVTMRWWDDVWLNEGFATWMANKVMASLHPEWQSWLLSAATSRERALQLDAGSATHPVVLPVVSIADVSEAFDPISYQKGGAVIRMIEETIGEAAFRQGMRRYMQKHAYGNTVTDQLWTELESASAKPVVAIAHDFTLQPGVPLLEAATRPCLDGVTTVTLAQSRFETDESSPQKLSWRIPTRVTAIGGRADAIAIVGPGAPTAVRVDGCGPVVVNSGLSGYVRTLYAPPDIERLRQEFSNVPAIDQLGLLSDAWALGQVGRVPAVTYLDFAKAAKADGDVLVWKQIADRLADIDPIFDGSADQEKWRAIARAMLHPQLQRVGWVPEAGQASSVALMRESVIVALGLLHDPVVIAETRRRFERAPSDPAVLPAAIHDAVLRVTAVHADSATWQEILTRARKESDPAEKQDMYARLGLALDPVLAKRALELALGDEPPSGSAPWILRSVSSRHPEIAFEYAVTNESAVLALIEASSRYSFIPRLAQSSSDPGLAQKLREYTESNVPRDARSGAEKAGAEILRRARSYANSRPQLEEWLQRDVKEKDAADATPAVVARPIPVGSLGTTRSGVARLP